MAHEPVRPWPADDRYPMISTLTSLLSRAEATATESEAADERTPDAGDGADASGTPDLAHVESDAAQAPGDGSTEGPTRGGDERSGDADRDPDTDWEFVSGMVDRTMTSEAETDPETAANASTDRDPGEVADGRSAQTAPDGASETVGAGPFARVPLADLEADRLSTVAAGVEPVRSDDATDGPAATDAAPDEDPTTTGADTSDSVLETLLAELEGADLSPADRVTVREALGVESPENVRVRLAHLQSDVADLRAYADAMERILEEESEADRLARDLGRRIDGLRDRLDETVTALDEDLAAETAAREAEVERLETRIEGVATTLTDSVMALYHDVEALRDEVETNRAWREDVSAAFSNADD